jgi:hypothetical protein
MKRKGREERDAHRAEASSARAHQRRAQRTGKNGTPTADPSAQSDTRKDRLSGSGRTKDVSRESVDCVTMGRREPQCTRVRHDALCASRRECRSEMHSGLMTRWCIQASRTAQRPDQTNPRSAHQGFSFLPPRCSTDLGFQKRFSSPSLPPFVRDRLSEMVRHEPQAACQTFLAEHRGERKMRLPGLYRGLACLRHRHCLLSGVRMDMRSGRENKHTPLPAGSTLRSDTPCPGLPTS